jgi:hypothetical protein
MSARGNGGRYEYYACTGSQKYGRPKACRNDRLPRAKLEQAVRAALDLTRAVVPCLPTPVELGRTVP